MADLFRYQRQGTNINSDGLDSTSEQSQLTGYGDRRSKPLAVLRRQVSIQAVPLPEDPEHCFDLVCNLALAHHSFTPVRVVQLASTGLLNPTQHPVRFKLAGQRQVC